jgi:hypothetical protein
MILPLLRRRPQIVDASATQEPSRSPAMRIRHLPLIRPVLLLALVLSVAACRDVAQLMALSAGIGTHFEVKDVSSNLNNHTHLTVVFDNSPVADEPEPVRAAMARKVAEYVRDHYASYSRLEQVTIEFNEGSAGSGFTGSRQVGSYSYTPAELGPAPGP